MQSIYLNYASTSPSLSARVAAACTEYLQAPLHLNAGRSFEGLADTAIALNARTSLAGLLGASSPSHIIFTSGVTASLNMALHGLLQPGSHVLATGVEHNAVARPLALMQRQGLADITWLPCAPNGTLDPACIHAAVRPNTKLLVMTHASNVLGTLLPFEACFAIAKQYGLYTVLDAAQTAGALPLRMGPHTDVLAFTGQKGLRGLAGVGGFAVSAGVAKQIHPWLAGGTGSASDKLEMPEYLPDRFEPGTQNTLGILSLGASVRELEQIGLEKIREQEKSLTRRFLDGACALPLTLHGTGDADTCMPVVSVSNPTHDAGVLARRLYDEYGILTRSGLHCAPLAHRTAGTFPAGTLRFSFGYDTTEAEIDASLSALETLLAQ